MENHPFKGYFSLSFNKYHPWVVGQFCAVCSGTKGNRYHWEYQDGPTTQTTQILEGDWRLG